MKIAIIADIHGNLPALEEVLDDINKKRADKIICLGDMVGKGPNSKEAVDLCRANCEVVIRGNWDAGLYEAHLALERGDENIDPRVIWNMRETGAEGVEYLGSLPHCAEMTLSRKLVRMFHAHPINFNRYFADSPIEERLELFGCGENSATKKQSDAAIYADIHCAYMQSISGKILTNVGSVGNPLDFPQSSYVMLEGEEMDDNAPFNMQFIRVQYDIDRAVALAKSKDTPDLEGYITELTVAKYFDRSRSQ